MGAQTQRSLVQLRGDGLSLECWNHTPGAIQTSLPRDQDHAVVWLFNLAALDERTPCHPGARQAPGESTSDFLARAAREDHGFAVPGRSLLAPDVVEG